MKPREPATETGVFSARVPAELLKRFRDAVKMAAPKYHNITHAVIVALTEFCEKQK